MKRGLVVSGGGSLGSFGVGIIDYLYNHNNIRWDVFIGSSTGSLISTLASTENIKKLKEEYISVNNDNIYSISPFDKKGKFKILNAIYRVLKGKKSLGEANKLKERLKLAFTYNDYINTINNNKTVITTTTNITKRKTEYKYQTKESYNDFIDWVFSSTSVPILFDVFEKDGYQYLDGALIEPIPIQKAINEGCTIIDVIVLLPIKTTNNKKMNNILDVTINTINIMYDEIYKNDFDIGKLYGFNNNIEINVYRTPHKLTNNLYLFDKENMTNWYFEGFKYAKNQSQNIISLVKNNKFRYDKK